MTDTLQAALIGLFGAVIGGGVAIFSQDMGIRAQSRHRRQEELRSMRERRRERLLDAIVGLLGASDIQSEFFSYSLVLRHVHHSQLLLDSREKVERDLAESIGRLAWAVHEYIHAQEHDISNKTREAQNLLRAQAEVSESCRRLVWTGAAGIPFPISY